MDRSEIESGYRKAAWAALEAFPVTAEKLELVSESENVTFRVSARGSDKDYVLRLHRPGYSSIEDLESERLWIRALKETGVTLQDSIETTRGGHYALVDISAAEKRYAGMTTWQEGIPLRDFLESYQDEQERMRVLRRFGEIAAIFHNQSTHWQLPPGFVRRRLDLDALLGEAPFWGRFWEHPELTESQRALLLQARNGLRTVLGAYGETAENFSLIHADFTPDNVIYNGEDLVVIDFDDAAFGWHMYDIASALIEYRFDRDYESLRSVFLDGYRKRRPLTKQDIDLLPEFELVRGLAVIGWFHQRPEYAGTAYFERFKNWAVEECERRAY